MTPSDALQKAILMHDGQAGLAAAIGVKNPQNVSNWVTRGRVPAEHCPSIERACAGKPLAPGESPVTCEALRPDVDWPYLRQTVKTHTAEATGAKAATSPASAWGVS